MLIARIRKSVFYQNIISLYGVQSVNYLLPLITVPFLTRILKPVGWGRVAFVQSLAMMVILVVEYGFTLSASRGVSIRRHDTGWLGRMLGSVTAAKISLLTIASGIVVCALRWIPYLREDPRLFYSGLLWPPRRE